MAYKVIMSALAQRQLRDFISYILNTFHSKQAARAVLADAKETKTRLVTVATNLKYCDDPELRNAGYRVIHLNRHRYFFVYQMKDADTVYIAAMYHDLQDYEALFKSENLNR